MSNIAPAALPAGPRFRIYRVLAPSPPGAGAEEPEGRMQDEERAEDAEPGRPPADADAEAPDAAAEPGAGAKAEHPDPAFESGGPRAPEPTRYGDWERKGIASDF